jgi:glycine hydroxymethyltransferase
LGTPALTTLGLGPDELDEVAGIIVEVLDATSPKSTKSGASQARYELSADVADASRKRCADLLAKFPLYPTIDL